MRTPLTSFCGNRTKGALLAGAALLMLGCPPPRPPNFNISLEDSAATLFFGPNADASSWLGSPVVVKDGEVKQLNYSPGAAWGDRCGDAEFAKQLRPALQSSFRVQTVLDSLRASSNQKFWGDVRANEILVLDPNASVDKWKGAFPADEQAKAEAFWPLIHAPTITMNWNPSSRLGFSRTAFDASVNVKAAEVLKVGTKVDHMVMHFFVVSQWGQFGLSPQAMTCLVAEAKAMPERPAYIVDSITLGVLFEFTVEATDVNVNAGGNVPGKLDISASVNVQDIKVASRLYGEIDPSQSVASIGEIFTPEALPHADLNIKKYFADFARSIKTPVFISANLKSLQ